MAMGTDAADDKSRDDMSALERISFVMNGGIGQSANSSTASTVIRVVFAVAGSSLPSTPGTAVNRQNPSGA